MPLVVGLPASPPTSRTSSCPKGTATHSPDDRPVSSSVVLIVRRSGVPCASPSRPTGPRACDQFENNPENDPPENDISRPPQQRYPGSPLQNLGGEGPRPGVFVRPGAPSR